MYPKKTFEWNWMLVRNKTHMRTLRSFNYIFLRKTFFGMLQSLFVSISTYVLINGNTSNWPNYQLTINHSYVQLNEKNTSSTNFKITLSKKIGKTVCVFGSSTKLKNSLKICLNNMEVILNWKTLFSEGIPNFKTNSCEILR